MDHNSVVRYLLIFARNGTSDIHLQAPIILKLTPQREQFKQSRICSTKLLRIKKDPYLAILAYRNTPVGYGKSPARLLFSRQLRSTLPVTAKQLDPSVPSKSALRKKMQISQTESKHYYDRSAKPMKPLNPGEGVRIWQGKLWKPAIVRKKTNDRSYIVEPQDVIDDIC